MQEGIVAFIVAGAVLYAVWRFAPLAIKRRLAASIAALAERLGASANQARRVSEAVAKATGCGSCDSCGTCAPKKAEAPVQLHRR